MLLLAAGLGRRFGSEVPKACLQCNGRSLVQRCTDRLAAVTDDREIILTCPPDRRDQLIRSLPPHLEDNGVTEIVSGGASRQESMRRALAASDPSFPLVLVHDAARPFLPIAATRQALRRAARIGAALLAIPAPDTLKRVDEDHHVLETLNRSGIWLAQTPQIVQRELLLRALDRAEQDGYEGTDDVSLLERTGVAIEVIEGSRTNIKVTTKADMEFAELIARAEDEE